MTELWEGGDSRVVEGSGMVEAEMQATVVVLGGEEEEEEWESGMCWRARKSGKRK
jgi:hypothetical protein